MGVRETSQCDHSQPLTATPAGPKAFTAGGVAPARRAAPNGGKGRLAGHISPHPPLSQSDQVSAPLRPHVSHSTVSGISFYKAVYSRAVTQTRDGASKESTYIKNLRVSTAAPPPLSQPRPSGLAPLPVSDAFAGSPLFISSVTQKLGNSRLLLCHSVSQSRFA